MSYEIMNYMEATLVARDYIFISSLHKNREQPTISVNFINIPALLETLALPMVVPMEFDQEEQSSRSGSQDLLVNKDRRMSSNGRLLNNDTNNGECACSR